MKLQALISASTLAAITAFSASAYAEEKAAPATEMKVEKAAPAQAAKPHSHVQEKTGVPQSVQPADPAKTSPAKDMSKHYHPRDMK
ncbi:hypothetical protein AT959_02245 [Dechloromonas denitrificans]|uniref:Uncharacterized protein n=1 Tax=Dechloromonas denitrificans TaxID=281362 RepID=A0A133XNK5_9RHOO|nr:hypothetical protein [Dechloromonas denitrificans]KXB32526.1 hypothetical protein AT959_02245 [Dechloromonas denitrificans]